MWQALTEHEQTEVGSNCLMGTEFEFCKMKSSENGSMAMVAQQYEGT